MLCTTATNREGRGEKRREREREMRGEEGRR